MALQKERTIKNTSVSVPDAYIRIIQDNTKYDGDNVTGKVDVAVYANSSDRINGVGPFDTLSYSIVPSVDTDSETYDAANTKEIDASAWFSETLLKEAGNTPRKQIYSFLKTQEIFVDAIDVDEV